ncbi:MAG: hypothetical protein WDZ41_05040 [Candidatus Babeliales bacterium]
MTIINFSLQKRKNQVSSKEVTGIDGFLLIDFIVVFLGVLTAISIAMAWLGSIVSWQTDALKRFEAVSFFSSLAERLSYDSELLNKKFFQERDIKFTWKVEQPVLHEIDDFLFIKQPVKQFKIVYIKAEWQGANKKPSFAEFNTGIFDES